MTMEELFVKRDVLKTLYKSKNPLVVVSLEDGTYLDSKYKQNIIDDLSNDGLIILCDSTTISNNMAVLEFINTDLGNILYEFDMMFDYIKSTEDENYEYLDVTFETFLVSGNRIDTTLRKYDSDEIECLLDLLSVEEQEAYTHYINIKASNERKSNGIQPVLQSIFDMSVVLGQKDSDPTRTNNYVFKKCMEELGEMAVEDQIENGLSYKSAGSDGVKGEAVDLAICAMDMFALQCPNKSSQEIEKEFLEYMAVKLTKWRDKLQEF